MVKQGIKIFCRIKPTRSKTGLYDIEEDEDGSSRLSFVVPKDLAAGFINNKKEEYTFLFEKSFDQKVKQDEIFEYVAKDVIDSVLSGYNGTIFAYGQTGSGKTFTITGGAERYTDRGIIPRTLSYIFEQQAKNPEYVSTTHISYLEIYNDYGYDLLDPKHEATKLEDLPKVSLMEDSDGNIHLKNLSIHPASNEEEALNLLFLGDTNRMIAETPMNQASTRSHCIFTIHVSRRQAGSATICRAKLHLVDLAGSERIGKTGVGGTLLTEAKYINLSLHFLEQVIVALSEKTRQHIPYRNSMMTSVLRDSLGGNCMTSMIATCSIEKKNIDESISTCRFAQRVALIKNDALLNEEVDPKVMIARLKGEIQELKNQLTLTSGEVSTEALSAEDLERLKEDIQRYIEDPDPEALLHVGADMRKINEGFRIFKRLCKGVSPSQMSLQPKSITQHHSKNVPVEEHSGEPDSYLSTHASLPRDEEIKKLQGLVLQRDTEINILVNMLKKEKKRAQDAMGQMQNGASVHRKLHSRSRLQSRSPEHPSDHGSSLSETSLNLPRSESEVLSRDMSRNKSIASQRSFDSSRLSVQTDSEEDMKKKHTRHKMILGDMSVGRQEAFDIFKRDYVHNDTIEEQKMNLKRKYTEAKALGKEVNESRQRINKLKSQIQHHRMQRAMEGMTDQDETEEEEELKIKMEEEKACYKEIFTSLKAMKTEIEHHQHFLEKSRLQMQKDFEIWWTEQSAQVQTDTSRNTPIRPPSHPGKAWKTPPVSPEKHLLNSHPTSNDSIEYSHTKRTHKYADQNSARSSKSRNQRGPSARTRNALLDALNTNSSSQVPPLGLSALDQSHQQESTERSMNPQKAGHADRSESFTSQSSIPLTGDKKADADIMAFIKARQNLLHK
ncbi:Kinesin-like protein KIF6 [Holothuria leucospilota]|uniref:Kinesin-like protein n=1 Tax=Holothuria leucospilota TaxID=206669 RepID=A0A9Q1CH49_HOLLE|nr:Kinesin-like protein KIF6 [Holothuria leucospilota]